MINNSLNIQIQDKLFTVDELKHFCSQKINNLETPVWEKDIFLFIEDWFSESNSIIVTTSGSTGIPKDLLLQKNHMIASANATLSFFNLGKGDTVWLCLPVKYIAGKMMIVRSIIGGLNLIYSEPISTPIIKANKKINFSAMVPNQVFKMLNSEQGIKQLQNINSILVGGSYISDELEKNLLSIPSISCWHSYGMTETISHIALRSLSSDIENRTFLPLEGVNIKANSNSQLIIDAPAIGVKNLITNDVVKLFKNNSFLIIGRIDNVIISGGIKLHPETIESKINKIISNDFFIGGIPDSILGEKLVLFIELSSDNYQYPDLLITKIKDTLLKFEIPKEVIFLKGFLRTENNKLKRKSMINNYIKSLS